LAGPIVQGNNGRLSGASERRNLAASIIWTYYL